MAFNFNELGLPASKRIAQAASGDILPNWDYFMRELLRITNAARARSGTFTPALEFGGGTAGLTYGTQSGQYYRTSELCFIQIHIILTAKGSSTGAAIITGLPYTSANTLDAALSVKADSLDSGVTTQVMAEVDSSNTQVSLGKFAAGSYTAMDEGDFSNTSELLLSGLFQTV